MPESHHKGVHGIDQKMDHPTVVAASHLEVVLVSFLRIEDLARKSHPINMV